MERRSRIWIAVLLAVVSTVACHWVGEHTTWFDPMERGLRDVFLRIQEAGQERSEGVSVAPEILVVGIDEAALKRFGKWPWSRMVMAQFLDRIRPYDPTVVFLDFLYTTPEKASEALLQGMTPEIRNHVESAYEAIDASLASSMKRFPSLFIDLSLLETPISPGEAFSETFMKNLQWIRPWSHPAHGEASLSFESLEPVIDRFVESSSPAVINVYPDADGVIRSFPLFYEIDTGTEGPRNVFSIVVNLLRVIYRVRNEDIEIRENGVWIRNAVTPTLNQKGSSSGIREMALAELNDRLSEDHLSSDPSSESTYNEALFRLCLLEARRHPDAPALEMPVHLLKTENGMFRILRGREIIDASRQAGKPKVGVVLYRMRDIWIHTPQAGLLPIHFLGAESRRIQDGPSGKSQHVYRMPTIGFERVFEFTDLPDLPQMDASGRWIFSDRRQIEAWFLSYCRNACISSGQDDKGPTHQANIYCAYADFLLQADALPGEFQKHYQAYSEDAKQKGGVQGKLLDETVVIDTLMEAYRNRYSLVEGKAILVGATAKGLGDTHATPFGMMSGITIIANALNTVMTDSMIGFSSEMAWLDVSVLFLFCLMTSLLYGFAPFRILPFFFLVVLMVTLIGSAGLFYFKSFFLRTIPLLFANLFLAMGTLLHRLVVEQRDKRFLETTFRSYLAPEVIQEMVQTRTMPVLGGEQRTLSVLFSDIAGFTRLSETLEPGQLIDMMNAYFSEMTQILLHEKGTLDKYIGDAIMAFFGAPLMMNDHALRACRTAVMMQECLRKLREKWQNDPRFPMEASGLRIRIGINTGQMIVGNMGSVIRMNYTVMGDDVNLASRLESACKHYGVSTLISRHTRDSRFLDETGTVKSVSDCVWTRYMDRVRVKGKRVPVEIYELMGMREEIDEHRKRLTERFHQGIDLYLKQKWLEAENVFQETLEMEESDPEGKNPSRIYVERCRFFQDHPPDLTSERWDGVFVMKEK
uniref:CHASE2 domain-containing protein n=1 Tax=Desulfatirhabdium butyrativorans TaxID=340467 RepID=A0A7C4RMM3_9BACT